MARLFELLILVAFTSCLDKANLPLEEKNQPNNQNPNFSITPFELTIIDSDYSGSYALKYVLTEKNLEIIFKSNLEGESDSIISRISLQPNDALKKLSFIEIDYLEERYSNPCINDESQITVKLNKNQRSKKIQLSNYYHPDIGLAIELINSLIPVKYRIWYDKEKLLKQQENCNI